MHPAKSTDRNLQIPSSGITLLEGPGSFGKEVRAVAQNWSVLLLSQGHAVHWIDGGHRFDPSKFFPAMRSLNCSIEESLRRLYIGRGFTLHQLHALIVRVRHELALTKASIIVIDGMLAMFLDEQIKRFESRSILRHCLASLEDLAKFCPVIILDGRTTSPLHQQLKHTMRPYLSQHFKGQWENQKQRRLRFTSNEQQYLVDIESQKMKDTQQRFQEVTSIDRVE